MDKAAWQSICYHNGKLLSCGCTHLEAIYKKAKKHFIENSESNIKIAIIYSKNKVFAVNHGKEKNLHNRYEGEFYDLPICQ